MFRYAKTLFLSGRLKGNVQLNSSQSHFRMVGSMKPPKGVNKDKDMPIEMENPYAEEDPKCLLCKYNVEIDYKNVRLLSQFVSAFSGKLYDRNFTGLCVYQQTRIEKAMKQARASGLMPYYFKEVQYKNDPELFDIERPFRPHKY